MRRIDSEQVTFDADYGELLEAVYGKCVTSPRGFAIGYARFRESGDPTVARRKGQPTLRLEGPVAA